MKDDDLRLALAHAIDRPAILDAVFRIAGQASDHTELTGPFPAYGGPAFLKEMPSLEAVSDNSADPLRSPIRLCEGKRQLGTGHIPHRDVANAGEFCCREAFNLSRKALLRRRVDHEVLWYIGHVPAVSGQPEP